MARHKSALKRHRQNEKIRLRNVAVRSGLRTATRKVREAVESGKPEEAMVLLGDAKRLLDKAVTKRVLHRNSASRKISRLTVLVNTLAPKKAA